MESTIPAPLPSVQHEDPPEKRAKNPTTQPFEGALCLLAVSVLFLHGLVWVCGVQPPPRAKDS